MKHIAGRKIALYGATFALSLTSSQVFGQGTAPKLISKDDAVRIALAHNQSLRAQRLTVDENKAQEVTALLKPNPNFSTLVDTIPIFSPSTIRFSTQVYSEALSYTVERGGKREKRGVVAKDNTQSAAQTVSDNERTLRFQVVQSFIGVLLAKSVLDLAKEDLANFSQEVELNHARLVAGDLAEGDYLKLSIQKLQFQQDVSAAQLSLVQARANLRQQLGYQSVADDFDVAGTLTHNKASVSLDDLQKTALATRPDLQAAQTGVKLANDTVALAFGNRARDWTWGGDYTNQNGGINGVGVSFSVDLPIHDRNQGEIARSQAAVRQSVETESSAQVVVLTDVVNAYYGLRSNEEIVTLYESGYLDQAKQSRDISTYAYEHGAATILDVLDAERSYRATQLAYRQALAAHMTAAEQVNEAVGTPGDPVTRLVAVTAAGLALCACNLSKQTPVAAAAPATDEASLFEVPQKQLAQLNIVDVQRTSWTSIVRTTGTVDWDSDHTTQAITQVNGPISRLLVDNGSPVTVNQPLLYVSSPDVAGAISTYRKATNRLEYSKRTLDRNKDLLDHKVIATKDLEASEQDYNDARSEVENDLQALKIYGVTQQEIDDAQHQGIPISPQLAVRSPISGVVVQKLVTPGLVIQAGTTACFTISDTSTVWVQGHIYDRDLEAVRVGDAVDETDSSFHRTFHGVISYIEALIDPATRTTSVRIVTKNPDGLLKKDMFVDAVIHTRSGRSLLAVPTQAILRNDENLPFVYVETRIGKFAQRLVTIGAEQDEDTEIVSGLHEGEKVVAQGAVFLQFANGNQ